MHSFADTVAWLLVSWYATIPSFWLIIHPFPNFWRHRTRSPYRVILPLWLLMIGAAAALTWPWRKVHLYDTPYSWLLFFLFAVGAIFFYRGSRSHISGPQVMGRAEVEPERHEQKLVSTGMHGRVRHPLYLGHLLMMLGWTVGSGLLVCYALTAFAILTGAIMIPLEEKELERRFGDQYREYKKSVPMLIPRSRSWQVSTRDDALPALDEFVRSLLAALPEGAARTESAPYGGVFIIPANPKASKIFLLDEGSGFGYHLEIGLGTIIEWQDRLTGEEIREVCKAVIDGRFAEIVWRRGDRVTKTVGTFQGFDWPPMVHWFSGAIPFFNGSKSTVRYEPYITPGSARS